ncbi:MAG: hypothetical protein LBS53_08950 [Synergistaceae bacterium]|nr:hypothetical protein [Synergistaceae bacterium]
MKCVYCKNEIKNYILAGADILARDPAESNLFGTATYSMALVECPHCDMIFFLKPSSKRLEGMRLLMEDELMSSMSEGVKDISKMTSEEKHARYEEIKKELLRQYT